jgi:hypothetical protein
VLQTIFCRDLTLCFLPTKLLHHPEQNPRREGGLRQTNTCRKVPLKVNFFFYQSNLAIALPTTTCELRHTSVRREFTICFYCLLLLNTGLKPLVLSECIVPNWFLVLVRKNVSNQGYLEVQCVINRQEFFFILEEYIQSGLVFSEPKRINIYRA